MSSVKDLVNKAKGNDRTIKQYSIESGVDAAVISKIIAGKYIPKKRSVYESLTSARAEPRGGVTCSQLMKAANSSKSFEEGMAEGLKAVSKLLDVIGHLPVSSLTKEPYILSTSLLDLTTELVKDVALVSKNKTSEESKALNAIQLFSATANGLIYGALGQKGVIFMPSSKADIGISVGSIDTYLKIQNQDIEEYILRYFYLKEEDRKESFVVKNTARRILEELVFLKANSKRKVSIVANCNEAYEEILKYKDTLSYRGNLSSVLISTDAVKIEKEEFISLYNEENEGMLLLV